jgi:hypothetical protein
LNNKKTAARFLFWGICFFDLIIENKKNLGKQRLLPINWQESYKLSPIDRV